MEYSTNELGNPVVYVLMRDNSDHYINEMHFEGVARDLEEVDQKKTSYSEVFECDMVTGEQISLTYLKTQKEYKAALSGLYKTGKKKQEIDALDIRKPFGDQLTFSLQAETRKIRSNKE